MSASIVKRGGKYSVIVEEGDQPARRCTECTPKARGKSASTPVAGTRVWTSDHDGDACTKCGAPLGPVALERRQRSGGVFQRRKDAEAAAAEVDVSKQHGAYVPPSKVTLGEFLVDQWLPAIQHTIRPNTFNSYAAEVRNHLVPSLGHVRLRDLGPEHLNRLYGDLLRDGYRYGGGLSKRSVQYCHIVIGRALSDATKWRLIVRNVAKDADPPRPERKVAQYWSPEQLRAFEHDLDDRLQPFWILAATTGARRGELCGLRWVDIDLDAARLMIVQTLVVVGGVPKISTPKTAAGRRTLTLDPLTISALRAWKARQAEERLGLGLGRADPPGPVFTTPDGQVIDPRAVLKAFKRRAAAAGLPEIPLHGLRHSFAAAAISAGESYKVVQERLGHASPSITLGTYSHVTAEAEEAAAHRIASRILGGDRVPRQPGGTQP